MSKNMSVGILFLFALQVGTLLYAQRSYNDLSLRRLELMRQRLVAEGVASEQADAIAFAIHSSEASVASEVWHVGHVVSMLGVSMILLAAVNKSGGNVGS